MSYYISCKGRYLTKEDKPTLEWGKAKIFDNFDMAWEKLEKMKGLYPTLEFKIKRIKKRVADGK